MRHYGLHYTSRVISAGFGVLLSFLPCVNAQTVATPYPILFVTQVPIPADFTTIGSVFGNHRATMQSVGRGGDLWIRYADGSLKNLTQTAGFGTVGFQGASAIAVRDPAVHWDGDKAVFSMVIGAPVQQYRYHDFRWQLYEVTGLGKNDTPVIAKVPGQPEDVNNVSPTYASDDRIIFTSDRPRNGAAHLYPQLDEYEEAPTTSGLWRLDPLTHELILLDHSPSGNFTPIVDSFGRVIFTRWDHLQRDQQADADAHYGTGERCDSGNFYGTFNYSDESEAAVPLFEERGEVFPEPRACRDDLLDGTPIQGHNFNHFFPWEINEDGTRSEVLGHLGRHELHDYLNASLSGDPNVIEFYGQYPRPNPNSVQNVLQLKESPTEPGTYYGTDAPEFRTHAAGMLVKFHAPEGVNADQVVVDYITHPDTRAPTSSPDADHSGLYREPVPLSNGDVIAVHTAQTQGDQNIGSRAFPESRYDFQLKHVAPTGTGYAAAAGSLTGGIVKSLSYWDPDVLVSYNGPLWELNPVEVRPRARPTPRMAELAVTEHDLLNELGIDLTALQQYLVGNNLALIASRDVTQRDDQDRQQPANLRVVAGTETIGSPGKIYDVAFMQFFQGDQVRGLTGRYSQTPRQGRRVLAQTLHDPAATQANGPVPGGPSGSVPVAIDGSIAAFVPARRAMTWQLTDAEGNGVVRERYWLTFQPGEVRVCGSCHGVNELDQAGNPAVSHAPLALRELLARWQTTQETVIFQDNFDIGDVVGWTKLVNGNATQVSPQAALNGENGLGIITDDTDRSFLVYRGTDGEVNLRASFNLNLDQLQMERGTRHVLFALDDNGKAILRVQLHQGFRGYQLVASVIDDQGKRANSGRINLTAGTHNVEFLWRAATNSANPDGEWVLRIDGEERSRIDRLDNDQQKVRITRIGALQGLDATTTGPMYFDDFKLSRP